MIPTRTVPPYVLSPDRDDEVWNETPSTLMPNALVRMSMTLPLVGRRVSQSRQPLGEVPDQDTLGHTGAYGSRWAEFMVATGAPRTQATKEQKRLAASIYGEYDRRREENRTLLSEKDTQPRRRDALLLRCKRGLMKNAFVPLFFRLFVLAMSVAAISLASSIFQQFDLKRDELDESCSKGVTTWMALFVAILAIIYTGYIAWDEFSSKPLGLRRPSSKLKLLLLDLIFLIFMSANVSLAWEALTSDTFPCRPTKLCSFSKHDTAICSRQKALIAVLMIAVVAWLSTFIVSLYRLVFQVEMSRRNIA